MKQDKQLHCFYLKPSKSLTHTQIEHFAFTKGFSARKSIETTTNLETTIHSASTQHTIGLT